MKHYLIDMDDTLYLHNGQMDYESVKEDTRLTYLCSQCPHPKYIYTNATFGHADILLQKMKLTDHFKKIYSRDDKIRNIDNTEFIYSMKPNNSSLLSVEKSIKLKHNNENNEFYFFDDLLENLHAGKKRKWFTIWISPIFYEKNKYSFVDLSFPNMKIALDYLNRYNS